jgi:tripartite-type tricarboxylate transporter receptor subunit TctC
MNSRRALQVGFLFMAFALLAFPGHAQTWPTRTVRIIVPYAPGGGSDILARLLAQRVSEELGQPFIVENRPGGAAIIGTQVVAKAQPDGYTIGVIDTAFTINPGLFTKLPYDVLRDFTPVTLIASSPLLMVVHPSVPVRNAKELVALAKARPGELSFSSAGNGTAIHLALELFKSANGINAVHVPYKGGGPSAAAVAAGEVAMTFSPPATAAPFIRGNRMRVLAITSPRRFAGLPDVPTLKEAGVVPVDANPYWALVAPAGTPEAVVSRLHASFAKHIRSPELRDKLTEMAFEPVGGTPAEFSAFVKADLARWAKVIHAAGIKPE